MTTLYQALILVVSAASGQVHQHLDGRVSIRFGPRVVAQWSAAPLPAPRIPRSASARLLGHRRTAA